MSPSARSFNTHQPVLDHKHYNGVRDNIQTARGLMRFTASYR